MLNYCLVTVMLIAFTAQKASAQQTSGCGEFGAIQLRSGHLPPNQGIVKFCDGSNWGEICGNGWDHYDAAVVCRELGYLADGAQTLYYEDDGNVIVINNVDCHSTEPRLRDCGYSNYSRYSNCQRVGGVRCRAFKNINVITVNNGNSVFVTWEYSNSTSRQPSSFDVRCFNEQKISESVRDGSSRASVGTLIPFASYNCCVSAKYGNTIAEITCTSIRSEDLFAPPEMFISRDSNMRADITGGVLGFIIVILVILLAICGGALLYLLRSRGVIPKRSSQHLDNNSTEMPVGRNISYVTAPPTRNGSQAINMVGQGGAAAEYSRIGPSYETTVNSRRQQPVAAGRNRIFARLSERYEFSEAHVAMASGGGGGGVQGETAIDYEVPLPSGENDEYSHLQH